MFFLPSHDVMNSNARATKQHCNACFTGSGGQHAERPITLILTLSSQFTSVTLSVDFCWPDSYDPRIMCLHIQNMDMLTYQTAKCSLTFYQRYSFTPDQFKKFAYALLVRRAAFIYTYFSKKFVCVKLGDFSSKNCKLSFFVQYI